MDKQPVAIFWDYENCHASATISGYELAESIRNVAHQHGPVKVFKAYMEISEQTSSRGLALRSELQTSGVSLTDCPHAGRKDVADKMMMVDMLAHAIDNPGPYTFILISGDRDFAYAAAVLRLRQYRVVVISPTLPAVHASLKSQASLCLDWTIDIMSKLAGAVISPQHVRRESAPVSAAPKPVEPIVIPEKPQAPPKVDASVQFPDSSVTTRLCPDSTPAPRYTPAPEPVLGRSPSGHRHSQSISAMTSGGLSGQTIMSYGPSYVPNTNLLRPSSFEVQYPSIASGFVPLPPIEGQGNAASTSVPSMMGLSGFSGTVARPVFNSSPAISQSQQPMMPKPTTPVVSTFPQPRPLIPSVKEMDVSSPLNHQRASSPTAPPSQSAKQVVVSQYSSPAAPISPLLERPTSAPAAPQSIRTLSPYFVTLVKLLAEYQAKGVERPLRGNIATLLGSSDFSQAGVERFREFSLLAEKAGIVIMGGVDGKDWISLAPDWDRGLSLPASLTAWVSVPAASSKTPEIIAPQAVAPVPVSSILPPSSAVNSDILSSQVKVQPLADSKPVPSPVKPISPATVQLSMSSSQPVTNATPVASTSTLPAQIQPVSKPVPQYFLTLVKVLEDYKAKGVQRPLRGTVAMLSSIQALYKQAGLTKFKEFSALAEKAGIVTMGGLEGEAWISLSPNWNGSKTTTVNSAPSSTPNVQQSSSQNHQRPVPPYFVALVKLLEDSKAKGILRPLRSSIGYAMGADQQLLTSYYKQAGVSKFKDFASKAEQAGIIILGGQDGGAWISLNPDWKGKVP
ncbi:NYN domain-containing protein [Mycena floridula]|nr:NYN domain-containing protein [Mycena floridula]